MADQSMTDITIQCPRCSILIKSAYDSTDTRPAIFGECTFCKCLFKWTKTKTIEIISAERCYVFTINRKQQYTYADTKPKYSRRNNILGRTDSSHVASTNPTTSRSATNNIIAGNRTNDSTDTSTTTTTSNGEPINKSAEVEED